MEWVHVPFEIVSTNNHDYFLFHIENTATMQISPISVHFGLKRSLNMVYSSIRSALRVTIASRTWPVPVFPLYFAILKKHRKYIKKWLPPDFKYYIFPFPNPFGSGSCCISQVQGSLCISLKYEKLWKYIGNGLPADLKYYEIILIMPSGPVRRVAHIPVHRPHPMVLLHCDIEMWSDRNCISLMPRAHG